MNVKFLEAALAEFNETVSYYKTQKEGLGSEFSEQVQAAIQRIIEYPEAWSFISRRTRRCRTKQFPYGIVYQFRGDTLLIIAVMHLHREPESWRGRIPRRQQ
jgi:plasmid stabilization system protein ParE